MSFNLKPESAYTANTQPVWSSFAMKAIMDLEQGPRFSASVMLLDSSWIWNMLNIQSGQENGKKELQPTTPHRPQDSRPEDRGSRSANQMATWWLWKFSVNRGQMILWSCCCQAWVVTYEHCKAPVRWGGQWQPTLRTTSFFLRDVAMQPSPKASMWSHVSCSASFCVDPGIKNGITFKDCIY